MGELELRKKIREAIHEAWFSNPGVGSRDTFGNFLDRACEAVYQLVIKELAKAK